MATVKLLVRGTRNPSPLYLRFINGRSFDASSKTGILINPEHWDNRTGKFRNLKEIPSRVKITSQLNKLQVDVVDKYNNAMLMGEVVDKRWLDETIDSFFNRSKQASREKIQKHLIYYIDFAEWWLENKAKAWKTGKNKYLDERAIRQYNSFLQIWRKFSGKKIYRINEVNCILIGRFIDFAQDSEDYSSNTIKRWVGRLRFFLLRAQTYEIKTAPDFQDRVYVEKDDDIMKPYLNVDEINSIFNLDLSNDDSLDNIRDSFIIALWSGLRISDFNRNLDVSNIDGEFINIKTFKTGQWVSIPLHKQVKMVLKKRGGMLPVKFSDKHVNEGIKTICMLAGIDNKMRGKKFDGEKKRSVIGEYKKYKLISSHSARRSWATNHHGLVPNHILTDIGGWASEKMFLHYVKRTKKESAEQLKKYYDEQYG